MDLLKQNHQLFCYCNMTCHSFIKDLKAKWFSCYKERDLSNVDMVEGSHTPVPMNRNYFSVFWWKAIYFHNMWSLKLFLCFKTNTKTILPQFIRIIQQFSFFTLAAGVKTHCINSTTNYMGTYGRLGIETSYITRQSSYICRLFYIFLISSGNCTANELLLFSQC